MKTRTYYASYLTEILAALPTTCAKAKFAEDILTDLATPIPNADAPGLARYLNGLIRNAGGHTSALTFGTGEAACTLARTGSRPYRFYCRPAASAIHSASTPPPGMPENLFHLEDTIALLQSPANARLLASAIYWLKQFQSLSALFTPPKP